MVGTIEKDVAASVPAAGDFQQTPALPELDEAGRSSSVVTAMIIVVGFFLGRMVMVIGMLQFMKRFEERQ